jgi:hypothetical protein
MSLATIRLRRAVNLAAHTPDQDRTAVVVARRAAAAEEDRHLTGIVEAHRHTAVAVANPTRAPAPTTVRGAASLSRKTE